MHVQATAPRSRKLITGASLAAAAALSLSLAAPASAAETTPNQDLSYSATDEVTGGDVALADAQNLINQFMNDGGSSDLIKEAEKAFNAFTQNGGGEDLLSQAESLVKGLNLPTDPAKLLENAPKDALEDPGALARYLEDELGVDVNQFLNTHGNTSVVADNSQVDDGKESRNGAGLKLIDDQQVSDRLHTLTFQTDELEGVQPKVNVLLPSNYDPNSDTEYPTIYLLHGGSGSYQEFMNKGVDGMVDDAIVVMPEGGIAGWYNDAKESNVGDRNWETFHTEQLIPYIDATYNTINQASARGIAGFSMGGFGSLKYTAKNPDMFDAVTSFSGPADIRDRLGAVTHWANASGVADNGSVHGVYGAPWDEAKVSADNPIENIEQYRDKRVHFYSGDAQDITEASVRAGHEKFDKALSDAGIDHSFNPFKGPHHVPEASLKAEMAGMVEFLDSPGVYDDPEVTLSTGEKPDESAESDKGSSDKDKDSSNVSEDNSDKDSKKSDEKADDKKADSSKDSKTDETDKDKSSKDDSKKDAEDTKEKDSKDDSKTDSDKSSSDKDDKEASDTLKKDVSEEEAERAALSAKWTGFFESVLK